MNANMKTKNMLKPAAKQTKAMPMPKAIAKPVSKKATAPKATMQKAKVAPASKKEATQKAKPVSKKAAAQKANSASNQATKETENMSASAKKKTPQETMAEMLKNNAKAVQDNMKNSFADFGQNMQKNFTDTVGNQFSRENTLSNHKKNMESLNEANQMALEVMKQIAQLQGRFIRQTFDDMTDMVREQMAAKQEAAKMKNPQDFMKSERVQGAVARALDHTQNLSNVMLRANQDIFKTVQNRFEEGMKEMGSAMNKTKH